MRWMIVALMLFAAGAWAQEITVAAAVSMKDVLTEIAREREAAGRGKVNFVFGSSGQIQQQIRNGAPIDVFISAAAKQMDELATAGAIDLATRRDIAGNRLVLIAPPRSTLPADSLNAVEWSKVKRLAIGEPATVPAGQYATEAIQKANLASTIAGKLVTAGNVRQVLNYVERGEVDLGIVYASDARVAGDRVRVILAIDSALHRPIVYPAAVVSRSKHAASARQFLDDFSDGAATKRLADFGFTAVPSTQPAR